MPRAPRVIVIKDLFESIVLETNESFVFKQQPKTIRVEKRLLSHELQIISTELQENIYVEILKIFVEKSL